MDFCVYDTWFLSDRASWASERPSEMTQRTPYCSSSSFRFCSVRISFPLVIIILSLCRTCRHSHFRLIEFTTTGNKKRMTFVHSLVRIFISLFVRLLANSIHHLIIRSWPCVHWFTPSFSSSYVHWFTPSFISSCVGSIRSRRLIQSLTCMIFVTWYSLVALCSSIYNNKIWELEWD